MRQLLAGLLLILLHHYIPAEVFANNKCSANSDAAACLCSGDGVDDAKFFPNLRDQALGVRRKLCVDAAPESETYQALFDMVNINNGVWFSQYGGFENGSDPLQTILDAMVSSDVESPFRVPNATLSLNDDILVGDDVFRPASPDLCPASECGPLFDEFLHYYNYAHTTLAAKGALSFARSINSLSKQWTNYLNNTRSQTPLELLINSKLFAHKELGQFAPPPDRQLIILHPSLVVENVDDAIEGEQTLEAIMVEFFGINWWRRSAWYRPSGASIIASYSDRPGVDDIGYGVAIHFRSLYSIGYVNHGGADGVLLSFDLLKLLENKTTVLKQMLP